MRWPFGRRRDEELREELESHLRMAAADHIDRGASPQDARRMAQHEFGNTGLVQEVTREFWGWRSAERLGQDLLFGVRLIRRYPGFSTLAIGCLALGIGVTTTMFAAVNGVLLHPLPYPDADRIVVIHSRNVKSDAAEIGAVSWADIVTWRRENHTLAALGGWSAGPADLISADGEASAIRVGSISPGVVESIGTMPAMGRTFEDRDQQFGNQFVVLLTHDFWMRHFGGAKDVVGGTLKIEQRPVPARDYRIIGVLPPGETFPEHVDVFTPAQMDADEFDRHGSRQMQGALARLKPGVGVTTARDDVLEISQRLKTSFPREMENRETTLRLLRDELAGDRRSAVVLLQAAALLVLIIAVANVAQLNLMRAHARRRELAVRAALGASRLRVLRQLVTESVALALAGGIIGSILAFYGVRALALLLPGGQPGYAKFSVDMTVLLFAAAVSIVTGVLSGVLPATREVIRVRSDRPRQMLVAIEVAVSVVLVIGAALMIRSTGAINRELGFKRNVIWFSVPTPARKYEGGPREVFFNDLVARVRGLPGVEAVGRGTMDTPLGRFGMRRRPVEVDGVPGTDQARESLIVEIDPSYLQTIGVPLVSGRTFRAGDDVAPDKHGPFAAVVNETFARRYLANRNPLGQTIRSALPGGQSLGTLSLNIVGVARDYRHERPPQAIPPTMFVYLPLGTSNTPLVVRATGDTAQIVAQVRAIVHAMDPDVRVADVDTFDASVARGLAREHLFQRVLGLFAVLALGMAIVGVYGVASYGAAQRVREFGIRVALGAAPRQLIQLALAQGVRLTLLGLGAGCVAAWWLTRFLEHALYGVRPHDPATFLAVSGILAVIALAAGLLPARRASRVDPVRILKAE